MEEITCPRCGGLGCLFDNEPCYECNGNGSYKDVFDFYDLDRR